MGGRDWLPALSDPFQAPATASSHTHRDWLGHGVGRASLPETPPMFSWAAAKRNHHYHPSPVFTCHRWSAQEPAVASDLSRCPAGTPRHGAVWGQKLPEWLQQRLLCPSQPQRAWGEAMAMKQRERKYLRGRGQWEEVKAEKGAP